MLVCNSVRFSRQYFLFLHTTRFYRKGPRNINRNNVGIKKRLDIFSQENPDLEKLKIDEEALDEIESELTSGSEMSDFHRKSMEQMKKKIDFMMIQRKYFDKVKLPNFLTWAEKEQIKELHRQEPNVWTYSKLSQSFPATPDIIKKVVASSWKAESSERILKHDTQVSKNWEMYRKGELELDPILEHHLSAFSSREHIQLIEDYNGVNVKIPSPAKGTEFTKIITDYQDKALRSAEKSNEPKKISDGTVGPAAGINQEYQIESLIEVNTSDFTPYVRDNHKGKYRQQQSMITLSELRNNIKAVADEGPVSGLDEAVLKGGEQGGTSVVTYVDDIETVPVKQWRKDPSLQTRQKDKITQNWDEVIPMRVKVPQDIPKGSVYKLKDAYYDTDGKFLYRVPGMRSVGDGSV